MEDGGPSNFFAEVSGVRLAQIVASVFEVRTNSTPVGIQAFTPSSLE